MEWFRQVVEEESSEAQKESIQVGVLYIYSLIGLSSYGECGIELIRPMSVIIDFSLTFQLCSGHREWLVDGNG